MQATLNIRLDKTLKERGDKVLKDNGLTVSEAIRGLWKEMATTRNVPDFLKPDSDTEARKQRKLKALNELWELSGKIAKDLDGSSPDIRNMTDKELRNYMYEEKYHEYMNLK